ncbi:DUF5919 domain-containing protein [Coleofasciculus sp. F4-SAH-05]|uniref:DUF5919 domain-containing protein n=1 Tax=Coleofasciculus sp. F4-SAH-05 TaxID=3069525 RepID=UPI003304A187
MTRTSPDGFKASLERILKRYQGAIAIILFIIGLGLRILAIDKTDAFWKITGDLGTFLAAAIAIPFIYESSIRAVDRQIFLSDLENTLEKKLTTTQTSSPRVYEIGRLPLQQKVAFLQEAKREVVQIGVALSSFTSYFEQRPFSECKQPVMELLQRGVNFKILILDPDSEIAKNYANDRGEPNLVDKIRQSLITLSRLRDEFRAASLPGSFELYLYSHFPYGNVIMVDPEEEDGCAFISHYLHGTKRADTPVFEVYKSSNPMLFEKYRYFLIKILGDSRKL